MLFFSFLFVWESRFFSARLFAPFREEDITGSPAHGRFIRVLTGKLAEVGGGGACYPYHLLGHLVNCAKTILKRSIVTFPLRVVQAKVDKSQKDNTTKPQNQNPKQSDMTRVTYTSDTIRRTTATHVAQARANLT